MALSKVEDTAVKAADTFRKTFANPPQLKRRADTA